LDFDANYRSPQYFTTDNSPVSLQPAYWLENARVAVASEDDHWDVGFYIKNIAGQTYRTYVNDLSGPPWGYVLNIWGPPRTFGINLNLRY